MTETVDYLDDILEGVEKIERYTAGIDYEEFVDDEKTVDAVLRNFEVIGEAAKNGKKYVWSIARFRGQRWPVCGTS